MSDLIICGRHGETRATFICAHMNRDWLDGRAPTMVCQEPIEDDPFPDAWCEDCEAEFQAVRDQLTDGFSPTGGLVALCARFYEDMRAVAAEAGSLRIV